MALDIIQSPQSISFSGNLKPLILACDQQVTLSLRHNSKVVFEGEVFYPDPTRRITVDISKLIDGLVSYSFPTVSLIETANIDSFTITINQTEAISFSAIKGGVDNDDIDSVVFLQANWLTWQPQTLRVTYNQPLWLRYYASTGVNVKVRAHFTNREAQEIVFSQIFTGINTINVSYPVISGKFPEPPQFYDVWIETLLGVRLSFIQRYIFCNGSHQDDYFIFQNSLGGFDSLRLTGQKTADSSMDTSQFRADSTDHELNVEYVESSKKNTGYIDSKETEKWILELFKSPQRYVVEGGLLKRIVISEPKLERKDFEANSFEFQFALARQTGYLNLPRTENLPAVLEIESANELFF